MRKYKKLWYHFHGKYLQKRKLKFIQWFYSKFPGKYCWADCVAWSFSATRFNPLKVDSSRGCMIESVTHDSGMCYCSGWNKGQCYDLLSEAEKRAVKEEYKEVDLTQIPF